MYLFIYLFIYFFQTTAMTSLTQNNQSQTNILQNQYSESSNVVSANAVTSQPSTHIVATKSLPQSTQQSSQHQLASIQTQHYQQSTETVVKDSSVKTDNPDVPPNTLNVVSVQSLDYAVSSALTDG